MNNNQTLSRSTDESNENKSIQGNRRTQSFIENVIKEVGSQLDVSK